MSDQKDKRNLINVSSVYGADSREPLVQVQWGDEEGVLSLDAARQLGRDLIEAASAAETDAFLMEFLEKRVGVKEIHHRAGVLLDFRQWRKEMKLD